MDDEVKAMKKRLVTDRAIPKNQTRVLPVVILVIVTFLGAYFVGFQYGKSYAYDTGYTEGKRVASDQAVKDYAQNLDSWSTSPINPLVVENNRLRDDYNSLVVDYNNLRNAAINYVNATTYQPRQTITCRTNTYFAEYGNISTTCN